MANALAIAGVTATLQYFLNLVYNHPNSALGGVTVSSVSPDLVQGTAGGANAGLHVNVFLHQVTHNASWRNVGFPSLGSDGATPLHNPPLALDLHYLLTAYGSEDTQAEALLGYAVLMLHENPTLPRAQIRAALGNLPTTNPLASVLGSSGLADQLEMIKITPSTLGREEMAWLWTALKADYRPTYPFQVSVVLIQPGAASSAALPVLSRNIGVQVGPTPELFQVVLPVGRTAVSPGDTVTLTGAGLTGATQVSLTYQKQGVKLPPPAIPLVGANDTSVSFVVPDDAVNVPAGVYSAAVLFTDATGAVLSSTAPVQLPLGPVILAAPAATATTSAAGTLVSLTCKPQVRPSQIVSLLFGSNSAAAVEFETATATPTFQFPVLTAGPYLARLSVDGVESPIAVNWNANPPVFTGPFVTV
jgi:hypothetical protein